MWSFVFTLSEQSLCFWLSSGCPVLELCWPSKPDILEIHLPSRGPLAREPNWGLRPFAPWGEFLNCDCPPICGSLTWGFGSWLYYISALLPISLWFLLSIFSCSKSFLVFRSFSPESYSINSCNFGMPIWERWIWFHWWIRMAFWVSRI